MNKKLLIWIIIAIVLIIAAGLFYYFYYWQVSADTFTQSYCAGTTGAAWKNCVQDMTTWEKFMQTHTNAQFTKLLNHFDKL